MFDPPSPGCYPTKLKVDFIFRCGLTLALGATTAACSHSPSSRSGRDGSDAQRLAAIVDYIGADYAGAVQNGQVLVASEYEEQTRFAADARRLGTELLGSARGGPVLSKLAELESLVHGKAEPGEVARVAREAREAVVRRFQLPTVPRTPPALERASTLYREGCAVCHGMAGDGDTERARALDPHPARFRDPAKLGRLSPYRVYNALTFGVAGTSMPSFDVLSPADRWDLAFFVFRLGHEGEPARGPVGLTLADMAASTDDDLLDRFRRSGQADPGAALAYARGEEAFLGRSGADVATARRLIADSESALRVGRPRDADRLAIDAYLQGFEPLEAGLRARDPGRVQAVESGFRDFRASIARGRIPEALARAAALDDLLAAAEGDARPTIPLTAAALIFFREGIEAALLIGALLAAARKLGRPEAVRYIHAGWLAAVPAGVATWWLLDRTLSGAAASRELLESVVALAAAAVLFSVSFWMISKVESRHWLDTLKRQVARGVNGRNLLVLAGLSFLALYREAAETILFTQALILESEARTEVWTGAALGTLGVIAAAVLMNRAVVRLPLGPFFGASGLLLCGLAVSFAGSGMHILVAAGYLPPRPVAFPEVDWMGIHPDLSGLLVQLLIVGTVAMGAVATFVRSRGPASESTR
jgi:high-affinity iron transporter